MVFEKIQDAYNETLVGEEFVYLSKYGSTTFGRVKEVIIRESSTTDLETGRELKLELSKVSPKVKVTKEDLEPIQVEKRWWGSTPQVIIRSENGTQYELNKDEIYFIGEENNS